MSQAPAAGLTYLLCSDDGLKGRRAVYIGPEESVESKALSVENTQYALRASAGSKPPKVTAGRLLVRIGGLRLLVHPSEIGPLAPTWNRGTDGIWRDENGWSLECRRRTEEPSLCSLYAHVWILCDQSGKQIGQGAEYELQAPGNNPPIEIADARWLAKVIAARPQPAVATAGTVLMPRSRQKKPEAGEA